MERNSTQLRERAVSCHKSSQHGPNQFCGLYSCLPNALAECLAIGHEITVHGCLEFDCKLHWFIVVDRAELKFGQRILLTRDKA